MRWPPVDHQSGAQIREVSFIESLESSYFDLELFQ